MSYTIKEQDKSMEIQVLNVRITYIKNNKMYIFGWGFLEERQSEGRPQTERIPNEPPPPPLLPRPRQAKA